LGNWGINKELGEGEERVVRIGPAVPCRAGARVCMSNFFFFLRAPAGGRFTHARWAVHHSHGPVPRFGVIFSLVLFPIPQKKSFFLSFFYIWIWQKELQNWILGTTTKVTVQHGHVTFDIVLLALVTLASTCKNTAPKATMLC
jgi:hypothetical protein